MAGVYCHHAAMVGGEEGVLLKLRHLDLFSGIGGFSLGLEATGGFKTIGFSEIEPYPCAVLKKHWPKVKNYGDVRTIPKIGCDIITGGFPCQPFSCAGNQDGKDDVRYLWPAMLAVIKKCNPTWILGENVPGITDLGLDAVCDVLENIGYDSQPIGIPACAINAKHIRERIFICAYSVGSRRKGWINEPNKKRKILEPSRLVSNGEWETFTAREKCKILGMADGIPGELDRIKAIGNSIVPQIAKILGEIILQVENS